MCIRPLTDEEESSKVADWVHYGAWNFSRLDGIVSKEVIQSLIALLPPREEAGDDLMVWGETAHGTFTVKSAYFMIEKPIQNHFGRVYKAIWSWKGVEKIRIFLWLAYSNRLPTNAWRSSWSSMSAVCLHCYQGVEDQLHILRDCPYARNIWLALISPRYTSTFFSLSINDWMELNLTEEVGVTMRGVWSQLWGVTVWLLWNWRNRAIFQDDYHKPNLPVSVIRTLWSSFCDGSVSREIFSDAVDRTNEGQRWTPPPFGWVKVSVDGAVARSSGKAGCGGVIRNHRGEWLIGFNQNLGMAGVVESEEWAILMGLRMAWEKGFRKVILETDSKIMIDRLRIGREDINCSLVLLQIRNFLNRLWEVELQFVCRSQNGLADAMAKEGISNSFASSVCPHKLRHLLLQDCMGLDPLSLYHLI
ncbi:hypothetical protein QN277_017543 [Acacia crassicarpa]|uniref:Uncharacterized protein n=1 Tax=Acacia crassicarpa TaxID=499986 RepID=A0AAE1MQM4_9FABA|nr:hypothetical protein QN277_017543 [Acacia crassicarpa]